MGKLNQAHPLFSALWPILEKRFHPLKQATLAQAQGHVLELGAGHGVNCTAYKAIESLVMIEPDPQLRKQADFFAERLSTPLPFPLKILPAVAEALPFPDNHFDTVVSTFVFCSVEHLEQALAETYRVLKPGGQLCFCEHVQARHPVAKSLLSLFSPLNKKMLGCNLDCPTLTQIEKAGFVLTELNQPRPGLPIYSGIAIAHK